MKKSNFRNHFGLVLVDATASLSGGAVYLQNLIANLHEYQVPFRVHLLRTSNFVIEVPEAGLTQITVEEIRIPVLATRYWLLGSLYKMFWRLTVLPFLILKMQPDIFFSNSGSLPFFLPDGVRPVVAIHNSLPFQPELFGVEVSRLRKWRLHLLRYQSKSLFREGVEIIVFSEDLRTRLVRQGAHRDQCTVIYHGIEWGEAERTAPLPQTISPRPFFLYVSQLHRYKNVLNLVRAFADLRRQYQNIDLLIVGHHTDAAYSQEIATTIDRLGLAGVVRIIPGIDRGKLIELYRTARAVVYTSLAENCPFALLESMAMGLPIAASRIGAITEICGDAAIYFDPDDPAEIARQMERLLEDLTLCETLSKRAISRAGAFTWKETVSRTSDLFLRLVDW